jgi:hypothetical protein
VIPARLVNDHPCKDVAHAAATRLDFGDKRRKQSQSE